MYRRIIVAVFVTALLLAPVAKAEIETPASKSALAVSPAIIENVLTPGEPSEFTVQVHNVTNFPLPIKTFMRGLTAESYTSDLTQDELARLDASLWFTIKDADFILQPNQLRTVTGTIQTPANADPGGHYATIFFQPLVPTEALSAATAYINARVGVLSFLIVKGDINQKAELKSGIQTNGLTQHGPITFTFSVHNAGNVHLLPTGALTINDMSGKRVAELAIPQGSILPNSSREYTMEWNAASFMNKYTAELTLEHGGSEDTPLPKTSVTFWVVPWVSLLFWTICLVALILFVVKTRRRWRKVWRELSGKKTYSIN